MSFVAYRGDAVGVIGRNGSGKSTLLRAIAGLLPAEQGTMFTTGEASLLGVNAALMDDLTGERNVILGCLAMGMTRQEARDKYQEIVDFSGVGEFIDLPMRTYSSGMGARLRFAIAAAKSHDVLLVDEALATGDAEFRVKSHARIEELREAGHGFLVAHNLEEVEETCNRVIWMERGRIVMEGDDVTGIIDRYIAASGGQPVMRDPETGHRLGGRQHAARNQPVAASKDEATAKSEPAAKAARDEPAAKNGPAALRTGPRPRTGPRQGTSPRRGPGSSGQARRPGPAGPPGPALAGTAVLMARRLRPAVLAARGASGPRC